MSEKITDTLMLNEFHKYFNIFYNTEPNKEFFENKIPDGWILIDSTLMIIENKANIKNDKLALKQVIGYAKSAIKSSKIFNILLINGFGVDTLIYFVYEFTREERLRKLNITLEELSLIYNINKNKTKAKITEKNIQTLHNLIVKETNLLATIDLSIFTAFLILSSNLPSIKKLLLIDNNSLLFSSLLMEFNRFYGKDIILNKYFNNNSTLENANLYNIFNIIINNNYNLNDLYKQFCKYTRAKQDKNIELTPDFVKEIMQYYVNIYAKEFNGEVSIIDPFSGTGSLLLDLPKEYQLNAIEITEYMYLMTKINFEINNIKNYTLKLNNMEEVDFKVNICITNPPYTKNISGKDAIEWLTELIDKVNVIIAIIPTSNILNSSYNKYKKLFLDNDYYLRYVIKCEKCFKNVGVDASIIIMDNLHDKSPFKLYQFNKKDLQSVLRAKQINLTKNGLVKLNDIYNDINYDLIKEYNENTDWSRVDKQFDMESFKKTLNKNIKEKIIKDLTDAINKNDVNGKYAEIIKLHAEMVKLFNEIYDKEITQINNNTYKEYFVKDLFNLVNKTHNYNYKTQEENNGNVPLFACKKLDNGIARYVDKEEYEGDCIIVVHHRDATCGYSFHYNGKFAWNQSCYVIDLKDEYKNEINLDYVADYLTKYIAPNHLQTESFNKDYLMNFKLIIPDEKSS